MTEGSSTGSHSRDAVAAAGVAVDPLPVCCSGAHPVSKGMIARNRPTTMAVKGSGVINDDLVRATSCVVWGKQRNIVDRRASHVPSRAGVISESIYGN